MSCNSDRTLSEVVDMYLILRGVQSKKYYPAYITAAFRAWKEIYQGVMWVQCSTWMSLKKGEPYDYIDVPRGIARFLSVNTVDKCGNVVGLYYNPQLNIIPEPKESTCGVGCKDCGCDSGLCGDVTSTIKTEKVLFVVNGVKYKESKWTKYCANGDIIEYTETPVKKYNDRIGSGGDFNNDYNNDYFTGTPGAFENMHVVYETSQRIICKLQVKPCGCPEDTEENADLLSKNCGCYLNPCRKRKRCYQVFAPVNGNGFGEVKMSECGTKIYYKYPPKNHCHKEFKIPTHLQVSYQVSGEAENSEITVPDGAQACLFAGIDYYTKVYNNRYNMTEKELSRIQWEREKSNYILYNNPITMSFLKAVQDTPIRW